MTINEVLLDLYLSHDPNIELVPMK